MVRYTKLRLKTWAMLLVAALAVEIATSWWTFMRASTDGLRPLYGMSFLSYEVDRIAAWFFFFLVASFIAFLFSRIDRAGERRGVGRLFIKGGAS